MTYVSCARMRELDRRAIEDFGIPGIVLMENAAVRFLDVLLDRYGPVAGRKVTVVCGSGNNGGDGFAVARHLFNRGARVRLLYTGTRPPGGDAGVNFTIARRMGIPLSPGVIGRAAVYRRHVSSAHVVVDAVFGTGLSRRVEGEYARLLQAVSGAERVMSVDIPSGLDGDTGMPLGTAVRAACTVTFGFPKKGFARPASREFTGEVVCVDISLPRRRKPRPA